LRAACSLYSDQYEYALHPTALAITSKNNVRQRSRNQVLLFLGMVAGMVAGMGHGNGHSSGHG